MGTCLARGTPDMAAVHLCSGCPLIWNATYCPSHPLSPVPSSLSILYGTSHAMLYSQVIIPLTSGRSWSSVGPGVLWAWRGGSLGTLLRYARITSGVRFPPPPRGVGGCPSLKSAHVCPSVDEVCVQDLVHSKQCSPPDPSCTTSTGYWIHSIPAAFQRSRSSACPPARATVLNQYGTLPIIQPSPTSLAAPHQGCHSSRF